MRDTQPPTVEIVEPQVPYGVEGISIKEDTIKLSGSSEDDHRVVKVKWESSRGAKGVAHMTFRGTQTDWEVPEVKIEEGDNRITVTALDAYANAATKTIWIVRNTQIEFISYPDASETDIRLSEATEVIFRVAVQESAKVKIESVKVVKVNENNEVLDTLATMYDDGKSEHGDEVPADGVYTAKVTLLEGNEGKVRFRVIVTGVKEGAGAVSAATEPFSAQVFPPVNLEEIKAEGVLQQESSKMYERLAGEVGEEEAGRRTVEWLKKQPFIKDAGAFEGGYSFVTDSGFHHIYDHRNRFSKQDIDPSELEPDAPEEPSVPAPPPAPTPAKKKLSPLRYKIKSRTESPRAELRNPKVLVVSPFSNQKPKLPARAYDDVHGLFRDHKCPVFKAERVKGAQPDVEVFKRMKEHDVVILDTHGEAFCPAGPSYHACPSKSHPTGGALVVTYTGSTCSGPNVIRYGDELSAGKLFCVQEKTRPLASHLVFSPSFVAAYNRPFRPGTVVFNGSCRSSYNASMAGAFLTAGASYYVGYSEYVRACYDSAVVRTFFKSLVAGSTTGQAFSAATNAHGFDDSHCFYLPLPKEYPAVLTPSGKMKTKITIEGFNNGSFEDRTAKGWDAKGDVRVITKLGSITAKDGHYMAFLTTGEKSENEVGSTLSQPFCVPANVSKIAFDYRLVSEEPLEFIDSAWRDTFDAALEVGGARTVLVSESTDTGPWSALAGVDFEGGDHTAFATDWKRVSSDIPESARTEGATLAFLIRDGGDYVYDTAVLIDGVRME